ncbi:MAG: hypothetical protein QM532_03890, partial [Cyanobium sp. MAG06]|nr:hypothetical protein [Cyanobium sp. MAG06]
KVSVNNNITNIDFIKNNTSSSTLNSISSDIVKENITKNVIKLEDNIIKEYNLSNKSTNTYPQTKYEDQQPF